MAVELSEFVGSLRREVTPPGSTLFADVDDDTWIGYLSDAFWEARLDKLLEHWTCDEDGTVLPLVTGDADLPRESVSLVVLYAGIKVLRNRIISMNSAFKAKAGPVEYEAQNSATVLAEMLRQLKATKESIKDALESEGTATAVIDAFSVRLFSPASYFGDISLTG